MSPGSSTESYPAFARIGLRENPGKNLNQIYYLLYLTSEARRKEGRKERRNERKKERKKEGRKEGRKERRKEEKKEGRKERRKKRRKKGKKEGRKERRKEERKEKRWKKLRKEEKKERRKGRRKEGRGLWLCLPSNRSRFRSSAAENQPHEPKTNLERVVSLREPALSCDAGCYGDSSMLGHESAASAAVRVAQVGSERRRDGIAPRGGEQNGVPESGAAPQTHPAERGASRRDPQGPGTTRGREEAAGAAGTGPQSGAAHAAARRVHGGRVRPLLLLQRHGTAGAGRPLRRHGAYAMHA
ncbi:hypothetical protein ANN_05239 [Periplaneta americana]|uniref:Uncharacterized protein n=1 Tax=Periplaneta americana TaxID=6978 RepID=A0ABQ8TC84_PERAM|nr:hypothetical protein ANN_05239 [Periplaneta americana]